VILQKLSLEEWKVMSKSAHALCFTDHQDPESLTCSYVLLVVDDTGIPLSYTSIIEHSKTSAYMQHGGAFPHIRSTVTVLKTYQMVLDFLKKNYNRITTRIQNINTRMLKLALSQGLLICGADSTDGETFVSFYWSKV